MHARDDECIEALRAAIVVAKAQRGFEVRANVWTPERRLTQSEKMHASWSRKRGAGPRTSRTYCNHCAYDTEHVDGQCARCPLVRTEPAQTGELND